MTEQKNDLVELLNSISKNERKAELAALRRGASDPFNNFEALRIIGYKIRDKSDRTFKNSMLLATLFGIHPKHIDNSNDNPNERYTLGKVLRKVSNTLDVGKESFDARFTLLLNADYEDLPHFLVQIFRYLANKDFGIDYNQLLKDLDYWTHPEKFVQFGWAKDYWSYNESSKNDNEKESKDEND